MKNMMMKRMRKIIRNNLLTRIPSLKSVGMFSESFMKMRIFLCFIFLFTLISLPIGAQEKAEPLKGEGVKAFLRRHNRTSEESFKKFIELNKDRLTDEQGLKLGFEYVLPPLANTSGNGAVKNDTSPKVSEKKTESVQSIPAKEIKTTPTANDDRKAQPLKGEGTKAFLLRHNCAGNVHYQQFLELNKDRLGPDNTLLMGVEYILPSKVVVKEQTVSPRATGLTEPLFGKQYGEYKIKSDKLKGACFYLVSCHGGPECGSVGKVGTMVLYEDEYAYDIMLRLGKVLMEQNAKVYFVVQDAEDGIRDDKYLSGNSVETCMGSIIPSNQANSLKQRVDKLNTLNRESDHNYRRSVFIHLDGRNEKEQGDINFYYIENSKTSENLANCMRNTFNEQYKKRYSDKKFTIGSAARNTYLLNNISSPSVLAVLGNIQNVYDQRLLLDKDYRQILAEWLALGLIKDFDNSKK